MISVLPPPTFKPFKIFCASLDRALGETIIRATFAATLKMHIRDAEVAVYLKQDRPYKAQIFSLAAHYIDRWITAPDDHVLPLDWLYTASDRIDVLGSEVFRQAGHATQDVILAPSGMLELDLLRYESWPQFRLPEARKDELFNRLVAAGVAEGHWLAVMHYREPTFPLRAKTPYRDVSSDAPFEALARHIIRDLGGQVVRIGHKEMREWEGMPEGFVDLSRSDDFMLHSAAISVSRFAVMSMGGPVSLCAPFGVPAMVSNAVGIAASGADPGFMLPKRLIGPGGEPADVAGLAEVGQWTTDLVWQATTAHGWKTEDNTLDELKAGVARLYAQTHPWPGGWRVPGEAPKVEKRGFEPQRPFVRKVNIWSPE